VHLLDGSHAYLVNLLPRRLPVVATVHDLIPLLTARGELAGPRPSALARWLWHLSVAGLRRCAGIAADSAATSRDVQRLAAACSDLLTVVHLPVVGQHARQAGDHDRLSIDRADDKAAGRAAPTSSPSVCSVCSVGQVPSAPYILHLGNNAAYKNREGVLRVFALVAPQSPARLVLAGPPPTESMRRLADSLGIAARVEWRTEVGDGELQDLYRSAGVLLFPSLYEGFGWPPLEAMACGCPVVCSNAASLPEVVGEAALLAGPNDHAALAQHCLEVLSRPEVRAELVRRGYENLKRFTLERFAAGLLDAYRAARRSV
jgi:glycosyltransferase involved in cell wall biosynthesis